MQAILKQSINHQRELLSSLLSASMQHAADRIALIMDNRLAMEMLLADELQAMRYCKHLYVLDADCCQLTANIRDGNPDASHFERDRSLRPYMQDVLNGAHFSLSDAYISKNKRRPSVTATQRIVNSQGELIGYLGADYDLRELPHSESMFKPDANWQQMKGDPSIRQGLFQQHRTESIFDRQIDEVLAIIKELITEHGVFHGKLHFSSSRATIWLVDDPYSYQVLAADEMLDADTCLAFPRRPYTRRATVARERLADIFQQFRSLRFADDNIYLRSGSLNVINGMVGLNFSCDGTHYMPYAEFLEKDLGFWFGSATTNVCGDNMP